MQKFVEFYKFILNLFQFFIDICKLVLRECSFIIILNMILSQLCITKYVVL